MILTIANAKGGVAKSTSSIYLAETIRRRGGGVTVYDADPQSTSSLWADAARDAGDPLDFEVRPANLSTLSRLHGSADKTGWSIVDAPPQGKLLQASLDAADFVIIPTSDSPLDLQQAWAMLDETRPHTSAAVLVVKAEPHTTAFRETMGALHQADTPRFDTVIPKRQRIKKALGTRPRELFEYRDLLSELEFLSHGFDDGEAE
ncbi:MULTISPECIES: ParA family protein [Bifidobacterium]|uniref:ParA family protein n=1 Tax=Bifidobacterium TaxID=1678 RepID=UPI00264716B0|nr:MULTISPECIES: ParA family protein [Bifidobacterium]MDN5978660.1 ParA family protein [Bifidobacterium mongoliense]MDN6016740.1 ParA family protein [Bifidobacterium mongoliense]MDN6467718.1 ParA family protein [Bifidobacterium crudilactis]MDN6558725.1 ParA family protein [Bifidobacterium crudilactis]MDN6622259.1 ParA family protein [Bifidobacterium crudilactis]